MVEKTRLVLLEGFLGSGKTTLMLEIGRRLAARGKKAGYITNDQGAYLVDTAFALSEGSAVAEVTGSCFCCNFPALIDNIAKLKESHDPDIIIAEAVGSCTDLGATVVLPLQERHGDSIEVVGYYVAVDGGRLPDEYSIRMNLLDPRSPKETLIAHQIKEAVNLLITKSDSLDEEDLAAGRQLLSRINPRARIRACSARDGSGVEELLDEILAGRETRIEAMVPLDYAVYARAEAEYGWYNGQWEEANDADDWDGFLRSLAAKLDSEIAHAKLLVESEGRRLKVSLVGERIERDLAGGSGHSGPIKVTLNVRARCSPERIVPAVEALIGRRQVSRYRHEALIPAPPSPTFRVQRERVG